MKVSVQPGNLKHLRRRVRGWAGVVATAQGIEFAVARAENGVTHVERESRVATVAELPQQFDPREYRVVTSVGAEDVLCQTLQLPTAEATELKQMLELQLDQLTPLPPEEVVYDFEPLDVREGQTQVLVAMARKSAVNDRVTALEEAGLTTEVVTVDMLAVFRGLMTKEVLPRDDKLGTLVLLKKGGVVVIMFAAGRPLAVRSILTGHNALETADTQAALREELQRTLLAEQANEPGRELGGITFLVQEDALQGAAEELSRGWPIPANCLNNESAPQPATSLCVEHTTTGARRLNLLPEEWRRRRQTARRRRLWWRAATAVVAVYVLAVLVSLVTFGIRKSQLAHVKAEKAKLAPQFAKACALESELTAMRLQLETKYSALDVLREVSELMPPNVKLTWFSFRRDDTVTLRGQADNAQAALDYRGRLAQSSLFSGLETRSMSTEHAGSLTKFELVATLQSAGTKPRGADRGAE